MEAALDEVRASFGTSYPLLIGDEQITSRLSSDVRYPADPSVVVGRVAQAAAHDVDAAVSAARGGFERWRDLPARERGDILRRAAELMGSRRYELAATMVFESAKPWAEADGDVAEAIDYCRYYALQGELLSEPELTLETSGEENVHFHEGRGVTAVVAPWNFALAIPTGMTVGALAGGNAAILKPAAQSPVIAAKLVSVLREAGVPSDVVQYLPGPGSVVGEGLVTHPGVDSIAFTGSMEVGLRIIELAGKTHPDQRNVKRVVAEMGGKNAIIIDDDADLDQAVQGTLVSAFGYAGQKCSACSRLIIVASAYDEALDRLKNAAESLIVGPPHDPATFVPPVIGPDARERIMRYIDEGRRSATLVAQAPVPDGEGSYVPPTVFADVPLDSPLAREEIFGPVLSVFRAESFEQALAIATSSRFALTGGVFSRNPRHIEQARRRFRIGNLYINRKTTGAVVGRQPFGGLLRSGLGEKAGGPDYVRQFMQPRTITENTVRRGFAPDE
jgi:RHH-type proline utilization regulon transcriptional repressor/proline dehydrogenase/delta 1-pyrroline-5-carboxylate dehydrogenase